MEEKVKVVEKLTVTKYKSKEDYQKGRPYAVEEEVCEGDGNCLLNAGITLMWNLIAGISAIHFASDTAQIGVGTDATAADPTQTDLLGSGVWKAMAEGYPEVSNQKITFQGVFGEDDANQAWNECGVRQAGVASTLMNRVVSAKGTKVQGEVWTAKLQITLS